MEEDAGVEEDIGSRIQVVGITTLSHIFNSLYEEGKHSRKTPMWSTFYRLVGLFVG